MNDHCHLYFHARCFDGVASAVIAWDYLSSIHSADEPELHAVDYDVRKTWLSTRLPRHSAVVDFPFHPDADFWADHHPTAFLTPAARRSFAQSKSRRRLLYDPSALSCASVLVRALRTVRPQMDSKFAELVHWADKIDAARYDSVQEAVNGYSPAQQIGAALAAIDDEAFGATVVRALRRQSLQEVAGSRQVAEAATALRSRQRQGLERLQRSIKLTGDELAVFDVDSRGTSVSRYAPFVVFPHARYSIGAVRWEGGGKVTAMRNPWLEFESAPIGELCAKLGGGGHRRVGSILLSSADEGAARRAIDALVEGIRAYHSSKRDWECWNASTSSTSTDT